MYATARIEQTWPVSTIATQACQIVTNDSTVAARNITYPDIFLGRLAVLRFLTLEGRLPQPQGHRLVCGQDAPLSSLIRSRKIPIR